MIAFGILALAVLAKRVDVWTLSPSLSVLVFGYPILRRMVRYNYVDRRTIRVRGGGYDATISAEEVIWAAQSGYPWMRHALVTFWLRPGSHRPRLLMTVNEPSRDLIPSLRAWGKLVGDWGDA